MVGTVDANLTPWREDDTFTLGFTKLRSEHFEPMGFALEPVPLVLPSGANTSIPVATPLAEESSQRRDAAAMQRREGVLLAVAAAAPGQRASIRDIASRVGAGESTVARDLSEMGSGRGALVEQDAVNRGFALTAAGKRAVQDIRGRNATAYRDASDPG